MPVTEKDITKHNECYYCKFKNNIPGDAHVQCTNPPDNMKGVTHGVNSGWFMFPINFDPVWKAVMCDNFKSIRA